MKYNNGDEVEIGDVIRWWCADNDDCTFWIFTGLVTGSGVVYLGGGIDFGMAIGQLMSYEKVQNQALFFYETGIEKVGVASKLACYIEKFGL